MLRLISLTKSFVAVILAMLVAFCALPALAGQASLAWNASASTDVTGYKVHYGTASGSYATHLDVGNSLTVSVPNLNSGATYYFAVTAYNSAGESGYSNEAAATIPVAAPVSSFSASATTGVAPLSTTFSSTSTGSITSYAWNFGDGTTGTGATASKTYSSVGTYVVTLTVTGSGGSSTSTQTVTATAAAPAASFTASTTSGVAPLSTTFTSTSTGSITGYAWNFGDGTTGSGATVSKTYSTPGTYNVTLTVTGSGGSSSSAKTITVNDAAPVSSFNATSTTGVAPLSTTFTSTSTGSITGYAWNFGDGTTSSGATVSKTYSTPGTYNVTLTVTGSGGSSSSAKSITVNTAAPVASFTASATTGVAPLSTTFNSTSTGSITSYAWNFGDGSSATGATVSKTYSTPGAYNVTLTVTGSGGSNVATQAVNVTAPDVTADFSATKTTGVAPLATSFTATASTGLTNFAWDFGDGSTVTGSSVSHSYASAGNYTVTLTATGSAGSKTVVKADYVQVSETLNADFTSNRVAGAVPLRVVFGGQVTGTINTYLWNFGDGATSTEANPVHTYRKPGTFNVSLTISGPLGTQQKIKTSYVTAVAANDVVVDFGPSSGIWSLTNGATWNRMDTRSARQLVMTDVDHNGASDVVVDLGADSLGKSLGIWKLTKAGTWYALDPRTAKNIVVGDVDGNGQDDLVFDFGSGGLWLLANGSAWSQIDTRTAKSMLLADLTKDGRDELVVDFGSGTGIWGYTASAGWNQIAPITSNWMLAADLDGNDQTDLVIGLGAGTTTSWGAQTGVWARFNGATWFQIDPLGASSGVAVNPDGNQKEELALSYAGQGLVLYSHTTPVGTNLTAYNTANWLRIGLQVPTRMIAADLNSDGKQDLVVDFGSTGTQTGLYKFSSGAWSKINAKTTRNMVSGQFR